MLLFTDIYSHMYIHVLLGIIWKTPLKVNVLRPTNYKLIKYPSSVQTKIVIFIYFYSTLINNLYLSSKNQWYQLY